MSPRAFKRARPTRLTRGGVMQLQRTVGNQATGRLLLGSVSRRVAAHDGQARKPRTPAQELSQTSSDDPAPTLQLKQAAGESGGGRGLPDEVLAKMENAFDADFSSVKIHADTPAAREVGALAYTQGDEIHFAPGQFNPHTSKGQELLGHELAHVIQQRQGRVKATTQAAGAPVNDDAALEREADAVGKKAARGEDVSSPSGTPQTSGVIQRAVGFEFETGWKVWEETGKNTSKFKPLSKKDVVGQYNGFKIEADEAGDGDAELEFIVHPPLEAVDMEMERLSFVMNYITIYGQDLLKAGKHKEIFRLMEVTGRRQDEKFLIKKGDDELKAGAQVTAGVSMDRLSEIGTARQGATLPEEFGRTVNTINSIRSTIEEAKVDELLPGPMSPQLKGLLSVTTAYMWGGEQRGLEYPKQIADVFLLARTDFAQLFRMLPDAEREFYKKNPRKFVTLALRVSGHEDAGDKPVIEHGIRPKPAASSSAAASSAPVAPSVPVGPTRDKWLFFITQGYDLLSAEFDKDFESMGEFGAKTEAVGPQSKQAGIFELRGAQTIKIPLQAWGAFAGKVFRYLINLEKEK